MSASIIIDKATKSAPWLVLVHGMAHDHRYFSAQTPCFESRYRIQLIDLPGHGLAAGAPGPFGPEEIAASVRAALEEAGIESMHFWGTHTGAGIGLLLAARQPDRFHSLILEAPVIPGMPPPYVAARLDAARRIAREHGVRRALDDWIDNSAWFEVMRKHPHRCRAAANRAMVMDFNATPWLDDTPPEPLRFDKEQLENVRAPVLIFNGEHDHPDFTDVSKRLEAILPHARRVHIAGAGGFPGWEFPGRVNTEVAGFLEQLDRAR